MNYINEMMKTAGVTQIRIKNECENCAYNMEECGFHYCEEFIYPDFTAEKQLEIIKLIGDTVDFCYNAFCMSSLTEHGEDDVIEIEIENDNFAQALTQLTTELMNAGDLDKEKVKEVLESEE